MSNILSLIFILAAVGITFGYVNPVYRGVTGSSELSKKSIIELKDEKSRYEMALQKTREIEEVRTGLLTRYNAIKEEDRKKLLKIVPDNIDSVRLIIDVNSIASAGYGMSLRDISLTETKTLDPRAEGFAVGENPKFYSYVTLGFSVSGSYSSLFSFLSDLEKSLRIIDIDSLSIDSVDNSSGGTSSKIKSGGQTYKMTVLLKTYYLSAK